MFLMNLVHKYVYVYTHSKQSTYMVCFRYDCANNVNALLAYHKFGDKHTDEPFLNAPTQQFVNMMHKLTGNQI